MSDVAFVPEIEVAANHVLDGSKKDLSAALTGALRDRQGGRADGLDLEDYLEWSPAANFKQSLGVRPGDRERVTKPYAKFS